MHESARPDPAPNLAAGTPEQLVATLAHANGWRRDTAQKLLVLRQAKTAAHALEAMLSSHSEPLARLHALRTLEGLGALTAAHIRTAAKDKDARVRHATIPASESIKDDSLIPDIKALVADADAGIAIQVMLTARHMKWKDVDRFISAATLMNPAKGVKVMAGQILSISTDFHHAFTAPEKELLTKGRVIFLELCYTCHGIDGTGMPIEGLEPGMTLAPPLAGSKVVLGHRDGLIRALMHGVTGPVGGKTYQSQMIGMGSNDDEWIAAALSYGRNSFSNSAACVTKEEVARVRREAKERTITQPWTEAELLAAGPPALPNASSWKVTASHGGESLAALTDGNPVISWSSVKAENIPMQLEVVLPTEIPLSGITLEAKTSDRTRLLTITTSSDGKSWNAPVFEGPASTALIALGSFLFTAISHAATMAMANAIGGYLRDGSFVAGPSGDNRWPNGEPPGFAIDGNFNNKYLNFGKTGTGLIVTPTAGSAGLALDGLSFYTANDAPERDPASYSVYGSSSLLSVNAAETAYATGSMTLLASGGLSLPDTRLTGPHSPVTWANETAYASYLIVFDTVKNPSAANSMQIAEVTFEGHAPVPEPASVTLAALAGLFLARRRR